MTISQPIGVAMLGNGFMARAHTKALLDAAVLSLGMRAIRLVSISGRDPLRLAASAEQYGYGRYTTDWRAQIADPEVSAVHNVALDETHCEPTLTALAAGKHVLCEKPLAPTAEQAFCMWRAAVAAGTVHMCGFNFRFAPAIRLARDMLMAGAIGQPRAFHARFLESTGLLTPVSSGPLELPAWGGAMQTLGAHITDLAGWFMGDAVRVHGTARREGPTDGPDDSFTALIDYSSGATGLLEGSRIAGGVTSDCAFRVEGADGSLAFSSLRLNHLRHIRPDHTLTEIEVTRPDHPFMGLWWPEPGHPLGWADTFTHEVVSFLSSIATQNTVRPDGADFEDGYRCAEVTDAISRSAASGSQEAVTYRQLTPATLCATRPHSPPRPLRSAMALQPHTRAAADWPVPHAKSRALFDRARLVSSGGAQGEGRGYLPYPLYIHHAHGGRISDIDGTEYTDCHNAFSSVILGHNHPVVLEATIETLRSRGAGFSAAHDLEVDLAYRLRDLIPSAEMAAFSCAGSEATYHAIRLARAITERNMILKFEGGYHGWHDAVAWSTAFPSTVDAGPPQSPRPIAASAGIAAGARNGVLVREYNDLAGLKAAFRDHGSELAAVIVEPIAVNAGLIEPDPDFLAALRQLTAEAGCLLIFDEIITGFRVAPGGAQQLYGADPDLTTLGKAFANGLPLSALVGKAKYMSRLATAGDVLFSGTHCGNVVAVGAALATLQVITTEPVHPHLDHLGTRLATGIREAIAATAVAAQVHQLGSIWVLHFTAQPIRRFRDIPFTGKHDSLSVAYRRWMLANGVYIHPANMIRGYLTAAHTEADVDHIVTATRQFLVDHRDELSPVNS